VAGPEVVWSSVEPIGPVRLVPTGDPVEMEFVSEVVQFVDCVVDETTQAVFVDGDPESVGLSWLHPRGYVLAEEARPTSFVDRGVLAPLGNAKNEFYALMETCAGLHVADRAGVLLGAQMVGRRRTDSSPVVGEALALFGCAAGPPAEHAVLVRVGTLHVPRFWVRPAGSGEEHFAAPRWAAAGYSREFLSDIRSRLLPVPNPGADVVAVDPGDARRRMHGEVVLACDQFNAVVWPDLTALGLAGRAAAYARLAGLVAVHSEANVNVIFLPDGAWVEELFSDDQTPGQFAALSDLRGLDYSATVVAPDELAVTASRAAELLIRHPRAVEEPVPVYAVTGVWDNADLLDDWLEHLRALGVNGVLAMDFGSTDGSVDILTGPRWSAFVTMMDFPGIGLDHSQLWMATARSLWPRGWALMIDPDEFLVTPTGRIDDPLLRGAMASSPVIEIARFEMTTLQSAVSDLAVGRPEAADLTLRRTVRDQGKVAVDLMSPATPSWSTHEAHGAVAVDVGGTASCLLHAPVRSFDRFVQKVDHAEQTLVELPELDQGFFQHFRRWVRIRDEGGLALEFIDQFVADDAVAGLLADGSHVQDTRLAVAIASARARRSDVR
jgi:hypothetical protein